MIRIEEIVEKVGGNHPQADLDMLRRAYFFSARHHKGQTRASGEPYLVHPLEVANILADMRLDDVSVTTGLLHDVLEDTLADRETLVEHFGEEVTHLVEGLTKLADRLHNMRTLHYLRPEKRKRIAQETIDIYAPIAHRLGMGKVRSELEDLAFRHLHPEDYRALAEQLEARRAEHEAFLEVVTRTVQEKLRESDVPFV